MTIHSSEVEARLMDLEMRLAFQERSLAEMSDALAASRAETAHATDLLQRALVDLRQLRTVLYSDPSTEAPPPHW